MTDKLRAAALAVLKSTKSLSVCCENFNHRKQDFHDDGECPPWRRYNDALAALEAALAEQEPEPVAWITKGGKGDLWWSRSVDEDGNNNLDDVPLYAAPPRREWVSLTKDEIAEIENEYIVDYRIPAGCSLNFAKDIEAKLREKNGL